jgi:hypothetical protein
MSWEYGLKRYEGGYLELTEIYYKQVYVNGNLPIG